MTEEAPEIKFEYQNPNNVEAEVPGSQNLRQVGENNKEFVDPKDGAVSNTEEHQNGKSYRQVKRSYTETHSEMVHGSEVTATTIRMSYGDGKEADVEEKKIEERRPKTKIPRLKFRQTVEKVKAERRMAKENEERVSPKSKINRHIKIPSPTTKPIVTKRNSALMDDEFEKIYEDLVDEQADFDDNILLNKIDDPEKVELTFEEIIHDYDENKDQPINVERVRQSRIPYLRHKSEQYGNTENVTSRKDGSEEIMKTGSSIPILRRKSEHDTDISKSSPKKSKEDHVKERTKISSIPLLRRRSEQGGDISKTTYSRTDNDGRVTETVTSITTSVPLSQVHLEKDSTSPTDRESDKTDQNKEDKTTAIEKTKIRNAIPTLIDGKDKRKVIRTFTRTVTTETVVSGKDKKKDGVKIDDKTEKNIEIRAKIEADNEIKSDDETVTESLSDTNITKLDSNIETKNSKVKEDIKTNVNSNKTLNKFEVEDLVKNSIRIAIPAFEAETENSKEKVQTVEMTNILEWKSNIDDNTDKKIVSPKFKAKYESTESKIIKTDKHINVTEQSNLISSMKSITTEIKEKEIPKSPVKERDNFTQVSGHITAIKSRSSINKQNSTENNEVGLKDTENMKTFVKESNEALTESYVTTATVQTSTITKQLSSDSNIQSVSETKDIDVVVKERDGSRFNKVSNLTILKGLDYVEILRSPKFLSNNNNNKAEKVSEILKSPKIIGNNFESSVSLKETQVYEVLTSPKLDKDEDVDLSPGYNIRIKRLSREMKHVDDSLKEWERDKKSPEKYQNKPVEIDLHRNANRTINIDAIFSTEKDKDIKTSDLDKDKNTDNININEMSLTKELNIQVIKEMQNDTKTLVSDKDKVFEDMRNEEKTILKETKAYIAGDRGRDTNIYTKDKDRTIENVRQTLSNENIKTVQDKSKDIEELGIKGKVGRIINKIDGKESENDRNKKEEEPIRRSVLSKVAMFERQEPLESIKARKPLQESKLPKLVIKDPQSPNHVHVHTPKIVEEVLKSADWNLNLNDDSDKFENITQITAVNTLFVKDNTINSNLKETLEIDSIKTTQNVETRLNDNNFAASNTKESVNKDINTIFQENQVDIDSKATTIEDNAIKDEVLTSAPDKLDFKVRINEDYNTVNLLQNIDMTNNVNKLEVPTNSLAIERSTIRDVATSPIRLSFDSKDFDNKVQNQVLPDAPVIIVHSKIIDNKSKSTEAIFTTQSKTDSKTITKKVDNLKIDRTTSMTEKLYPEKVKSNIALYESIKNESYSKLNEDKVLKRASSTSIFESYKNERYNKVNKISDRTPYTPQNSINMNYSEVIDSNKIDPYSVKFESSISIDERKLNKIGKLSDRPEYNSLQFISKTIKNEPINYESITSMNNAESRNSFTKLITTANTNNSVANERLKLIQKFNATSNYEPYSLGKNTGNGQEIKTEATAIKYEEIRPINETVHESISYEVGSKDAYDGKKIISDHKFRKYRSKNIEDDDELMMKSLPNLDLDDPVKGKVSRMISRMRSVEQNDQKKEIFNIKEMPRKLSVLEKIAMFEGKATHQTKADTTTIRTKTHLKPKCLTQNLPENVYQERIEELRNAAVKFGRVSDMPTMTLRNGQKMPVLALGTALLDPSLLKHIICAAIDLGYRAIDTAYIYGNEKEIGEAIKAKIDDGTVKREELFIMSKLWSTFHKSDLVETACRASLEAMGLTYFDLYLIHNPMSLKEGSDPLPRIATVLQYSQHDYLDAWFGMEALVPKGLARGIGVSNFNSVQLQRLMDKGKIKPSVNQVECHPFLTQQRLDQFCAERNIKLSCYGTLGSKGTPDEYKNSTTAVIDDALVIVMASGLNVTPAQLLIRYQLECERTVVVKSSSAAHLWDNLQALNFRLTSVQIDALHALNRNKRTFTFQGMGDTHKNYPFLVAF